MHLPSLGRRLHSSIVEGFISKTEVTFVATALENRKTVQEFCVGKGKRELYSVENAMSVLQVQRGVLPNEREGMSVSWFLAPAMWRVVNGDAFRIWSRSANARIKCIAIGDRRDANRWIQPTDGLLSLYRAIRAAERSSTIASIKSHTMTKPAHSRSEFVIVPVGFRSETSSRCTSFGHSNRNTVGGTAFSSPTTIPPTPCLDVSHTPT